MNESLPRKIKILVVDDSAFMRKVLLDILKTESFVESIDIARNGEECIKKAELMKPDIITLDVEMPIMDGLTALEKLIKIKPLPIVIMLSSLTTTGADTTIRALELGAVDFIAKPKGLLFKDNINELKRELIDKIKVLIASKGITVPIKIPIVKKDLDSFTQVKVDKVLVRNLVGIGTSTGGPRALQSVITQLPEDSLTAYFVVQHMPPVFTKSLAERLDGISKVRVKEAEANEYVKAGYVYIAPGDYHMEVIKDLDDRLKIIINQNPLVNNHRPSVDVMLDSLSKIRGKKLIAVIMTGMGSDGAKGLQNIKISGGITIAQNEDTSVVYGMPKAAIATNSVDFVAPLEDIANTIQKSIGV